MQFSIDDASWVFYLFDSMAITAMDTEKSEQ